MLIVDYGYFDMLREGSLRDALSSNPISMLFAGVLPGLTAFLVISSGAALVFSLLRKSPFLLNWSARWMVMGWILGYGHLLWNWWNYSRLVLAFSATRPKPAEVIEGANYNLWWLFYLSVASAVLLFGQLIGVVSQRNVKGSYKEPFAT